MKLLSLLMIVLGGIILGYHGLLNIQPSVPQPPRNYAAIVEDDKLGSILGGIVMVSGLIMLASSGRRDDA